MDGMITLKDVCKTYCIGGDTVHALDHANMVIREGEFVSIIGPSGSGKSTMMNIIGCLDTADEGTISWMGFPLKIIQSGSWQRSGIIRSDLFFRVLTCSPN